MADNDPDDADLIVKLSKPIGEEDLPSIIKELRSHKVLRKVQEYLNKVASEANELLVDLPNGPAKAALNNLTLALINRST
jgi:heptaprenyl diphosphate synthase